MDLIMDQSKIIKVKYQMIGLITLISFIMGLIQMKDLSLVFILPMFYVSFMCGYLSVCGFFLGLILSTILTMNYTLIIVLLFCFMFLMLCMTLHTMDARYVPYMLSLISGIYYAYIQSDVYKTCLYVILTLINLLIYSNLVPVFMHSHKELLTSERLKAMGVMLFVCTLSIMPYSHLMMFMMIRVITLIYIYYECLDEILPGLFYISLFILLESVNYQNDILCILIPVTFFYMIKVKHKATIASLYIVSHMIMPLITDYTYNHFISMIMSVFLFLIIPIYKNKPLYNDHNINIKNQLSKQVDSFCRLFEQMTNLFNQIPPLNHTSEYLGYIYEDMCQHCTSKDTCFHSKYGPNRLIKLMDKGLKESFNESDYQFIHEYCIKPKQYKDMIKKYKHDYKKLERMQLEYHNMKKEVYHQFSLLNDVFHQFSSKLAQGSIEEKHIYEHMLGHHFKITHLKKYYESQSVYYIEIGLYEVSKDDIVNEFIPILESYLNETLQIHTLKSPMKKLGYTYLVLSHKTRYYTEYGIVQCSKEHICGDSYEVFAMHEHMYFALSDGMGQGEKASQDSLLTLDVLKQLIINGISLKDTIQSINSLLKIKNRNDMFTTLDMCQINLSLAIASFAKYGACPTYILRNNEVIEISSQSLPVGIVSPLKTSLIKYQLKEKDIIFMITDGFISSFKELINKNSHILSDTHPKEMNHMIMNLLDNEDKNDDMTLLTIKVCKQ